MRGLFCRLLPVLPENVGLLLYLFCPEDRIRDPGCVFTDPFCPSAEPVSVPLEVVLMIPGHVLLNRAVLVLAAIQAPVGGNTALLIEDFDDAAGNPDIDFLPDVFVRN